MIDIKYLSKKHQLTSLETNILLYISDNIENKQNISIRKVATNNFTSTSVIYRCIKKIGFDSYMNFIYFLKNRKILEHNISTLDNNFNSGINLLTKHKDSLIMFISTGIGNNIANYMNERLILKGIRSISNCHLQLLEKNNSNKLLLVIISQSGETKSILDILKFASLNKIDSISFLGVNNSTIEKFSTTSLILKEKIFYSEVIKIFEELIDKI